MTEEEWLKCKNPQLMLKFLATLKKKRKLALFGVACCRRIPRLTQEQSSSAALDIAEHYADRKAKIEELRIANRKALPKGDYSHLSRPALKCYLAEHAALCNAACNAQLMLRQTLEATLNVTAEKACQCALLREIFGNPFQRVRINNAWLTSTVVSLAQQMYDTRDFSAMPILADALMDASCDNETILTHCRGPGPHVRGCWAIDLLTNRE